MHLSIDVQWQCCLRVQSRERCSTAMLYRLTTYATAQLLQSLHRGLHSQAAQCLLVSHDASARTRDAPAADKHP